MRKELGKWLMDISKYITTAVILTSIFGDIAQMDYIFRRCYLYIINTRYRLVARPR